MANSVPLPVAALSEMRLVSSMKTELMSKRLGDGEAGIREHAAVRSLGVRAEDEPAGGLFSAW